MDFILRSLSTELLKLISFQKGRKVNTSMQSVYLYLVDNNDVADEKARIEALRKCKCHAWAVLAVAKCHGSLLTL